MMLRFITIQLLFKHGQNVTGDINLDLKKLLGRLEQRTDKYYKHFTPH